MSVRAFSGLPRLAGRTVLVGVIGLAVGAFTQYLELHVPHSLEPLCNTAAPWIIVASCLAACASRVTEAMVLAIVAFVTMIIGFYIGQALRGWGMPGDQVTFWCLRAALVGPLVGAAAGWLRHSRASLGAIGAGVIGGLVVGEAGYGLEKWRFWTVPLYWHVELVIGVGVTLLLALWAARWDRPTVLPAVALSALTCVVMGALTLAAYQTY